jgi:tRNA(Ile)-lysidine synthase
MRLTKGAGFIELLGFSTITKRENFNIIRPLLNISKDELLNYLNKNGYKYFIDKSNSDIKYERNYFRAKFSNSLIDEYRDGIKRSFEYMQKDKEVFLKGYKEIFNYQKFYIIKLLNRDLKIRVIDIYLKKLGYLLSSAQREEIEKSNSIVIGGIWAIEIVDNLIYISLYIKTKMPKKFREKCRVLKIPSKSRGYIYIKDIIEKLA